MTYWKQIEITDALGNIAGATAFGELRVVEAIRQAGGIFTGTTLDPNFATGSVTGSGTITQANSELTLATGVTANSSAMAQSTDIARYSAVSQMRFLGRVRMSNAGSVNNTRRWGAFNGTDGCYYKLAGTVLSACTMIGGVETAVASTSWNGNQTVPTLTDANAWEIYYTTLTVTFVINYAVAHVATFPTSMWTSVLHLPVRSDNVNTGGGTANVSLIARLAAIERMGKFNTQPKFFHGTTAATTVLKFSPGLLHRLVLNDPTGNLITLYDNTAGSGAVIAVINTPAQADPVTLEYGVTFQTGLTAVSTGTWDYTVIYE